MSHSIDVSSTVYSPISPKDRNSSSTGVSQEFSDIQERINGIDYGMENLKSSTISFFQPEIIQPEINSKLHRRAIHVLLNICWDRDIDQDCLWTALMIFYAFKAKRIIKKGQLSKIVSVCILLSCKLLRPEKLDLKDIIQITSGKYSTKQLTQTEGEILNTLDFNLYIENSMNNVLASYNLTEEQTNEVFCLSEMLITKNSQVFWKSTVLCYLINLVLQVPFENSIEIKKDIIDITKFKQGEFILRKYSSKLNTQKILQKLKRN